jgi:hypothetical protein
MHDSLILESNRVYRKWYNEIPNHDRLLVQQAVRVGVNWNVISHFIRTAKAVQNVTDDIGAYNRATRIIEFGIALKEGGEAPTA